MGLPCPSRGWFATRKKARAIAGKISQNVGVAAVAERLLPKRDKAKVVQAAIRPAPKPRTIIVRSPKACSARRRPPSSGLPGKCSSRCLRHEELFRGVVFFLNHTILA